jgi:hypothetical protein
MAKLPAQSIASSWGALQWQSGVYVVATNSATKPLIVQAAPREAGLYRMTWTGTADWGKLSKILQVRAAGKKLMGLDFAHCQPPVLLTIGRTTNIHNRLRQHFSTNPYSNRVLTRLTSLLPGSTSPDTIRELARVNLSVEWVPVACWVDRCLLEHYGLVTGLPLLDIDAEH